MKIMKAEAAYSPAEFRARERAINSHARRLAAAIGEALTMDKAEWDHILASADLECNNAEMDIRRLEAQLEKARLRLQDAERVRASLHTFRNR